MIQYRCVCVSQWQALWPLVYVFCFTWRTTRPDNRFE